MVQSLDTTERDEKETTVLTFKSFDFTLGLVL